MAWASGVFTRFFGSTGWQDDKAALIKILASRHDSHDQDMAQGFNVLLQNLQANAHFKVGAIGGTANAISGNLTPAITTYTQGQFIVLTPTAPNTAATTLAVNGLSSLSLQNIDATACVGGELLTGVPVVLCLNVGATAWIIINPNVLKSRGLEVGYRNLPQDIVPGNYTFVDADRGRLKIYTGAGGHTWTVAANTIEATGVIIYQNSGTGTFQIAGSGGVAISWYGGAGVVGGTRTIAIGGKGSLNVRVPASVCDIDGVGIS